MNIYKFIGRKIKMLRKKASLGEKEMSNRAHIPVEKLIKIEKGETKYGIILLFCMCEILNVKPKELFADFDD